jgi:hypothetical protein
MSNDVEVEGNILGSLVELSMLLYADQYFGKFILSSPEMTLFLYWFYL